jgi:hypothetical protein
MRMAASVACGFIVAAAYCRPLMTGRRVVVKRGSGPSGSCVIVGVIVMAWMKGRPRRHANISKADRFIAALRVLVDWGIMGGQAEAVKLGMEAGPSDPAGG